MGILHCAAVAFLCADAQHHAGCRPQWVQPRVLTGWDIATDVTPVALEAAFARAAYAGRPAKAALVVSPSYFGTTSDVPGAVILAQHLRTVAASCPQIPK